MAFIAQGIPYTDARVASIVETYDPNRLRGPDTGCVVDEQSGDLMLQLSESRDGIYDGTSPRLVFLLRSRRGDRKVISGQQKKINRERKAEITWLLHGVTALTGDSIDDSDWQLAADALRAVGFHFSMLGVAESTVQRDEGESK